MNSVIKKIFFEDKNTYIPLGSCYAVLAGDYHGEIFVFFKQIDNTLMFVSLPSMVLREVEISKLEIGLKENILDSLEILPKDVYEVIECHGNNLMGG